MTARTVIGVCSGRVRASRCSYCATRPGGGAARSSVSVSGGAERSPPAHRRGGTWPTPGPLRVSGTGSEHARPRGRVRDLRSAHLGLCTRGSVTSRSCSSVRADGHQPRRAPGLHRHRYGNAGDCTGGRIRSSTRMPPAPPACLHRATVAGTYAQSFGVWPRGAHRSPTPCSRAWPPRRACGDSRSSTGRAVTAGSFTGWELHASRHPGQLVGPVAPSRGRHRGIGARARDLPFYRRCRSANTRLRFLRWRASRSTADAHVVRRRADALLRSTASVSTPPLAHRPASSVSHRQQRRLHRRDYRFVEPGNPSGAIVPSVAIGTRHVVSTVVRTCRAGRRRSTTSRSRASTLPRVAGPRDLGLGGGDVGSFTSLATQRLLRTGRSGVFPSCRAG